MDDAYYLDRARQLIEAWGQRLGADVEILSLEFTSTYNSDGYEMYFPWVEGRLRVGGYEVIFSRHAESDAAFLLPMPDTQTCERVATLAEFGEAIEELERRQGGIQKRRRRRWF